MRTSSLILTLVTIIFVFVGGWPIKPSEEATGAEGATKHIGMVLGQWSIIIVSGVTILNTLVGGLLEQRCQILAGSLSLLRLLSIA